MPKKKKKGPPPPKKKADSGISKWNPFKQLGLWVQARHPVFKFLLGFIGSMALFYIFYYSALYRDYLEGSFLHAQASLSNLLLRVLGQGTEVVGSSIAGSEFSVDLKNGCDGLEAIAIFVSGILIFPVSFRLKARGIGWGVLTLFILNLLRIAGLYLVGLYFPPSVFEVLHVQGGFVIFTMISVILWFTWMNWAIKQPPSSTEKE